jgi:hypothetical protein
MHEETRLARLLDWLRDMSLLADCGCSTDLPVHIPRPKESEFENVVRSARAGHSRKPMMTKPRRVWVEYSGMPGAHLQFRLTCPQGAPF